MKIRSLVLASLLTLSPVWAYGQTANGKVTTTAPTYTNNQAAPLSLDTSGNLRVTGSFTPPAVQNVQGNVAGGAADSGNPVKIGGIYNSTLSATSSGYRTDMQSDAYGNVRTMPVAPTIAASDGQANTVTRFVANSTPSSSYPLQVYPSVYNGLTWDRTPGNTSGVIVQGNVADGTADTGNSVKIGGVYSTTSPNLLNGQRGYLRLNSAAALFTVTSAQTIGLTDSLSNSAQLASGATASSTSTSALYTVNLPFNFNGATWDRQRGDVNGTWIVPSATSSGTSNFSAILAASTNSTSVKSSAGIITEISVYNSSATIAWLKLYDASSAPTCGSGTPVGRYMIPGAASGGAGSNVSIDLGKTFSTGIAFCVTAGIGDADTTAVAASTYTVNMTYK